MKKTIFTGLILLALVLQSCNNNKPFTIKDYSCKTSYQIENKTNKVVNVVIASGYIANDDNSEKLSTTTSIDPGLKKEVYMDSKICGKNTTITEFDGEVLPIVLDNLSVDVSVDNKQINDNILNKENWDFAAEKYYKATYLLVITDSLIESVGHIDE